MANWLGRLWALRTLISTQMYIGIGSVVALTIAASFVGWVSFNRVGAAQNRVENESLPEMEAAFRMAEYSRTLAAAAPRLVASRPTEVDAITEEIRQAQEGFESQILLLQRLARTEDHIRTYIPNAQAVFFQLLFNIDRIQGQLSEHYTLVQRAEALRLLIIDLRSQLDDIIVPAIDDQLFYQLTGFRDLGQPPASRTLYLSETEFNRYRHLAALKSEATLATQLLSSGLSVSDVAYIEPLQESFESTSGRLAISLGAIEGTDLHTSLTPLFDQLLSTATAEGDGFGLLIEKLRLEESQDALLLHATELAAQLTTEVDGLVTSANQAADAANQASDNAINTGRALLVTISILGVLAAFAISYGFVGRILLRRIHMLSARMRQMADGDLEGEVNIKGRDEVADMAAALEVFRRHALEVQRLNLVEKMAAELVEKNSQLEEVLSELERAQDQIVMQEKLAALGEVTAGVAHEIRNPLNFVKNFSEASEELLEELQEILEEDDLDEDEIDEIVDDLTDNLDRIRRHSERANRIVQDMLMMGRGGGEWQIVDLNTVFNEHAQLAYHSARAVDPDFQLHIERDFDPDVGDIEAIPQDLGRVFLNMVGNSCHSTDSKRVSILETPRGDTPYMPTVWLMTKRVGDRVQVMIRDNGDGIPADVVDKIFNPFFTTKPTDKGTGLGLALSSDIVRTHGGTISVDTEEGEFAQMTVELPLRRPDGAAEADQAYADRLIDPDEDEDENDFDEDE
ncbi:sensor histidine kinase [Candidatus Spongiisocius sp.]|uniref:sensor histidine kinase n=1 Tax=Candidatus Spongiisocius sp. TaxID=3101273 RepID=UPI003B5CD7AD